MICIIWTLSVLANQESFNFICILGQILPLSFVAQLDIQMSPVLTLVPVAEVSLWQKKGEKSSCILPRCLFSLIFLSS